MKTRLAAFVLVALAGWAGPAPTPASAATAQATPAPTDQWLTCPSVGVPTKIDPILKSGKLTCYYYNAQRASELLTTRVVSTSTPLRSCLRSRTDSGRVFCSTTKTQAELTATAYKWARWTGADQEHTRGKIGWKKKRNGPTGYGPSTNLYPCRFKKDGSYRVGYVDGNMCWAPYKGGQASTTVFENLLLTQEYGQLRTYGRYGAPVLGVPSSQVVINGTPRTLERPLCLLYISPDPWDFQGVMGELPGMQLLSGPQLSQGPCLSSHYGKEMQKFTGTKGNIVLE